MVAAYACKVEMMLVTRILRTTNGRDDGRRTLHPPHGPYGPCKDGAYAWHAWPPCGTPFDHVGVPSAAEAWLALVLTGLFVCVSSSTPSYVVPDRHRQDVVLCHSSLLAAEYSGMLPTLFRRCHSRRGILTRQFSAIDRT